MNDIKVIIDIGAKDSTYPSGYPEATCHLFEPNPKHAKELRERYPNAIVNEYGIGEEGMRRYDPYSESFIHGTYRDLVLPLRSLDEYVKDNNIKNIYILKVDTEGMDYEILRDNPNAVLMSDTIIFEEWDNLYKFEELLKGMFSIKDIGERNYLCKKIKQN